jgi:PDZ domain
MSLRKLALVLVLLGTTDLSFAKDPPLMTLSADHFRDSAVINDDPVANVTTVSTEKGYVEHHGPLRAVWNDEYLFGIVDRKAGRKTLEVITVVTYRGSRRSYGQAKVQGANGTTTVPTVHMKTSSINCPTGECTYTDQLSFPVDESLLRQLAAHAADKPELWHFSLVEPSGNYTGELSTAEIAGFLAKIDEYTGAAPPPPPRAAAKLELGIGGLRVEPTPQNPSRFGVLVTAVVPGSVADKAGIIVGDIVSELSGHPIKGPADLQSAVAASSVPSGITFKIYRGTTEMTLRSM